MSTLGPALGQSGVAQPKRMEWLSLLGNISFQTSCYPRTTPDHLGCIGTLLRRHSRAAQRPIRVPSWNGQATLVNARVHEAPCTAPGLNSAHRRSRALYWRVAVASSALPEPLDNEAVVQCHYRGLGHPRDRNGELRPVARLLPMIGNAGR